MNNEITIDAAQWYKMLNDKLENLTHATMTLNAHFERLEQQLANNQEGSEKNIAELRALFKQMESKIYEIQARLRPLEDSAMVKNRLQRFANSSLGSKLVVLVAGLTVGAGSFQFLDSEKGSHAQQKIAHVFNKGEKSNNRPGSDSQACRF